MSVGHMVNKHGIPDKCPKCHKKDPDVRVVNYDPVWRDGDVVCAHCGHKFRDYDAG